MLSPKRLAKSLTFVLSIILELHESCKPFSHHRKYFRSKDEKNIVTLDFLWYNFERKITQTEGLDI